MKSIVLNKSQSEQVHVQQQQQHHDSKPQVESRSPKKEKEVEAIKEQQHLVYSTKPRMRVLKPTQKFRFTFDWDTIQDISLDDDDDDDDADSLFGCGFVDQNKTSSAKNGVVVNQDLTKKSLEDMKERVEYF